MKTYEVSLVFYSGQDQAEWDSRNDYWNFLEPEEIKRVSDAEDAIGAYVREHTCGLGDLFCCYGGDFCHDSQSCRPAKVEFMVRELPSKEDYRTTPWSKHTVRIYADVEYRVEV